VTPGYPARQIKELLGLRLNFFEKADDFRYASFDFPGRFSFVRDFEDPLFIRETRP
jgi:hypothetical protein